MDTTAWIEESVYLIVGENAQFKVEVERRSRNRLPLARIFFQWWSRHK
jgi:hypothetical protein